jgi:hypothetical protein
MKKSEGRPRRDRAQWSALLSEWRASGVTGREFARLKGLKVANLYYWSSTLGRQVDQPERQAPKLLPVELTTNMARPARLELLVGAARIRFEEGASPAYVAELVRALAVGARRSFPPRSACGSRPSP